MPAADRALRASWSEAQPPGTPPPDATPIGCTITVHRTERVSPHPVVGSGASRLNSFHFNVFRARTASARFVQKARGMKRLTVDGLRAALPDVDELRSLLDHLLAESDADPARTWSGSGRLGSAGDRLVAVDGLLESARKLAAADFDHHRSISEHAARAVIALHRGREEDAARELLGAAALEEARDRPDRAEAFAHSAHTVARESDDVALRALALRRRARARRTLGRLEASEADYREAARVAQAASDVRGSAEATIGAGNICHEQGRRDEAEACYRAALESLDTLDAPSPERWHAELNLHIVLRSKGSLDASVGPLERAAEIARALADAAAEQFLENARGQLDMARGAFDEAEAHLRQAVGASTGTRAEVTIRLNLAETLLAVGRTLDAAEEARRAERAALIGRLPQKLPEVYRILGRITAAEGEEDAFVFFERALEIIRDRALPALERAQTLQAYAEAESEAGREDNAAPLAQEAMRLYGTLGIDRKRSRWAERFDRAFEETEDTSSDINEP